jgi:hypothetical protein
VTLEVRGAYFVVKESIMQELICKPGASMFIRDGNVVVQYEAVQEEPEPKKPREFWITDAVWRGTDGFFRQAYQNKTNSFVEEIHVREVLPGSITITEDQFIKAYNRWIKDPKAIAGSDGLLEKMREIL